MKKTYKQLNNSLYQFFYSVPIFAIVLQQKLRYQQVIKDQKNVTTAECHQIKFEDKWKWLINYSTSVSTTLRSSNNHSKDFLGMLDFDGDTWLKNVDECAQAFNINYHMIHTLTSYTPSKIINHQQKIFTIQ